MDTSRGWLRLFTAASLALVICVFSQITSHAQGAVATPATGSGIWAGVYTEAQAKRGEPLATSCAKCHGGAFAGDIGPPLVGAKFLEIWDMQSLGDLFTIIHDTMPMNDPGTLSPQETADILSRLLQLNKFPAGAKELPIDVEALKLIKIESQRPAARAPAAPAVPAAQAAAVSAPGIWAGVYTEVQAKRGAYTANTTCSVCHGNDLGGGFTSDKTGNEPVPPLVGPEFAASWNRQSVGDLFDRIHTTMPWDNPGSLSAQDAVDVLAHVLELNGFPAGQKELPADAKPLKLIKIDLQPPAK